MPSSAMGDLLGAVNRVAINAGLPGGGGGLRVVGQTDGVGRAVVLDNPPYSALPQIGTIFHRQEGAEGEGERKTLMLC